MDLARLYRERFPLREHAHRQRLWEVLVRHFLQRYVHPEHAVLDLGGGRCEFINAVRCTKKFVVDLNPMTHEYAERGVTVVPAPLTDLRPVADGVIDVVLASNVFEHLHDTEELLHALEEVCRILKPNGSLLVIQPNIRFAYREYWDFLDHHLPLSDRTLREALCHQGFRIDVCIPQFLPFSTKDHIPQAPWLLRLYLRLPWLWRIVGKQLFLVARKPS